MTEEFHFEHDVALSYAFSRGDPQERDLMQRVCNSLSDAGIRIYLIEEDAAPGNKRWARRYYEALFRSRYLVPVLSRQYLMGDGARKELSAIVELCDARRSSGFFYPLVPIVPSVDFLKSEAMSKADRMVSIDPEQYKWLKTHSFPVLLDWGVATVRRFFQSLVRGSRGEVNLDWLRLVSSQICAVRFEERCGRATAQVHLQNPLFHHAFEFQLGARGVRFGGCYFELEDALEDFDKQKIVELLAEHLRSGDGGGAIARCPGCGFRRKWSAEDRAVCPFCTTPLVHTEVHLREPQKHDFFLCESCGHVGLPVSFDIGAECPKCGGQMWDRGGESVKRLLLGSYGKKKH